VQSPFPVVRTSFLSALAHVLSQYTGGVSTWAVSKSPSSARTSTAGKCHLFCMRCSDCWTVRAAATEKPSKQLTGHRPYTEPLGAAGGPESLVVLLPELRWSDGAGGRSPFLHTPVSQWICLFCSSPRLCWLFPGPGHTKLRCHQTKRKANFSWLP